jgi:hypothetical protein
MSVLPGVETAGNVGITPKMSDDAFRQLRAYIYEFTGIYFQDNKKYLLEGRIGKREKRTAPLVRRCDHQ